MSDVQIPEQAGDDAAADRGDERRGLVLEALRQYWGYDSLRPLQETAVYAGVAGRDALVVMPTGGGKSLCFQIPPLLHGGLTVVISPLIALMKDQVDGLKLLDYPAACLNSSMEVDDINATMRSMNDGTLRLLYIAPERVLAPGFLSKLAACNQRRGPHSFAIDEAHCISQWGHDFRPEYRRLAELREAFPRASFQAFTATATQRVREDIIAQLGLRQPEVLIGTFDRPNLTYRVIPKVDPIGQIEQIIRRHTDGATIVYAISRKYTEEIADELRRRGIQAAAYHAGLDPHSRRQVQEDFSQERVDVVVATVAFGMGIDRGNVRCVIHAELPKSIEHYQQETGRAGRDGLESECVLLYASGDAGRWKAVMQRGAQEQGLGPESLRHQFAMIDEVQRFATGTGCRHEVLSRYFGQEYQPAMDDGCGACDVCLGELESLPDSTVIAKKILSCVARMAQHTPDLYFGANHLIDVLRGSRRKQIMDRGHETLTTYGLLREMPQLQLLSCVNQLVDLGYLRRSEGAYPVLSLAGKAWDVLRGSAEVSFSTPREPVAESREGAYDEGCFEVLRRLRAKFAAERNVAAYIIFSDGSLQEMARVRPTREETFAGISGVGRRRLVDFGAAFCEAIARYCAEQELETNLAAAKEPPRPMLRRKGTAQGRKAEAFTMFAAKANIVDVAAHFGLSPRTVADYLVDYVVQERPESVAAWVDAHAYARVVAAADTVGESLLKPIFEHLEGTIGYDQIKVVLAHRRLAGS
jgi:ATP-dependent DNA helicase RecQ